MSEEQEGYVEDSDDGLDDLIDAELGPKEEDLPDGEESDKQEEDQQEAPEADEDSAEGPAAEDEPEDEDKEPEEEGQSDEVEFKYKGKKYTLDDLKKDEKLRAKIFTSAEQHSHFQSLYDDTRKRMEEQAKLIEELRNAEYQRQQQAVEAARRRDEQDSTAKISPDYLTTVYKDSVKKMVDDGWIEEDISELYPNAVAGVMSMRDEFALRIEQLENAIGMIISEANQEHSVRSRQSLKQRFDSIFDQLASEGEIFEPLKSEETRNQFLTEVSQKINPALGPLLETPDALRQLWIAAHHDKLVEQARREYEQKLTAAEADKSKRNRQLAVGEGGGARPGTRVPQDPTEQQLIDEETWGSL